MPIGIPYNILQYTIVNKIVAMCSGHIPGVVRGVLGNAHYYLDQAEGVKEIISREEEVTKCPKPQLVISERLIEKVWCGEMLELSDFAVDGSDFKVVDYNPLGAIKMPVAV